MDLLAVAPNGPLQKVDRDPVRLDHLTFRFGREPLAERCAHPRQQLLGVERFGHIVVRAQVEGCNLLLRLIACRDNDHGRARVGAEQLDQLESVAIGQSKVEEDEFRLVDGLRIQRLARS